MKPTNSKLFSCAAVFYTMFPGKLGRWWLGFAGLNWKNQ